MKSGNFDRWLAALEARHLADLTLREVARALRALSSAYVERRHHIARGAALTGAGKRAAFALFYGPLHYLLVREIVRVLPGATEHTSTIFDLGCGTGASAAAWAAACTRPPRPLRVLGIDRHQWAVAEASRTYREFGLASQVRRADIVSTPLPRPPVSVLAAFAINELTKVDRDALRQRLFDRARGRFGRLATSRVDQLLIVEPIARFVTPWWDEWRQTVVSAGGRADEWRFRVDLPPIVAKLDRAAGLNHRELTARSLWLGSDLDFCTDSQGGSRS